MVLILVDGLRLVTVSWCVWDPYLSFVLSSRWGLVFLPISKCCLEGIQTSVTDPWKCSSSQVSLTQKPYFLNSLAKLQSDQGAHVYICLLITQTNSQCNHNSLHQRGPLTFLRNSFCLSQCGAHHFCPVYRFISVII